MYNTIKLIVNLGTIIHCYSWCYYGKKVHWCYRDQITKRFLRWQCKMREHCNRTLIPIVKRMCFKYWSSCSNIWIIKLLTRILLETKRRINIWYILLTLLHFFLKSTLKHSASELLVLSSTRTKTNQQPFKFLTYQSFKNTL